MQKYEIMAIFSNDLKEAEAEKQTHTSILKNIESAGGNVTFEDFWGARGFAYIIQKQKWGYYFVAQFELDASKVEELKKEWNLDNKIVRFLITKVDSDMPSPRPYAEMKKESDALSKKKDSKAEDVKAKSTQSPLTKDKLSTVKKDEPEAAKPDKKEGEPKKDSVDKKLDDIIKDSSLDL